MNVKDLSSVPENPGCYFWLDDKGQIIYIGKAKNLKKRMTSYFNKDVSGKTKILVENISSFSFVVSMSEKEALIMESNLIRKHSPKYNIKLKSSSSYPLVALQYNNGSTRLFISYKKIKTSSSDSKISYFGPFPSGTSIRKIVDILNKKFPLRKCNDRLKGICLYEETGNCLGNGKDKESSEKYLELYYKIEKIFKGNISNLRNVLEESMNEFASMDQFEEALEVRNIINESSSLFSQKEHILLHNDLSSYDIFGYYKKDDYISIHIDFLRYGEIVSFNNFLSISYSLAEDEVLDFIYQFYINNPLPKNIIISDILDDKSFEGSKVINPIKGTKKSFLDVANLNAKKYHENEIKVKKLSDEYKQNSLVELSNLVGIDSNDRIEVFDVANINGKNNVSGMIVLKNGNFLKNEYRKYNLYEFEQTNDYKSIEEVIYRRYFYLKKNNLEMPSLIIVDGGLGQYNIAKKVLHDLNLNIKLISLSKDKNHKTSKLVIDGEYREIPENLFSLLLSIQEEVHRYVNTFFRNKVNSKMFESSLDKISGVSDTSKSKLIKKFGNVLVIKKMNIESLSKVIPISQAKKVYDYYNKN